MNLSSKGDYATRVLLELSMNQWPHALSVHQLADRTGISPKYLEQIMLRLRAADVVRSRRGVQGGYELARGPDQLTVGEVVRLMDGPLAPSPCASRSAHVPCPLYRWPTEERCVFCGLRRAGRGAISGVLDRTTVAQFAERQRAARAHARLRA